MKDWEFKDNSLDLIRLIAASQVMILHSVEYVLPSIAFHWFFDLLRLFPGVPIFFFISGMLISRSFERSPSLFDYYRNRVLRIYPALFVCVALNIYMVALTDYFDTVETSVTELFGLAIAKSTILQFYNPDYMRGFGDGVLNGSLWTICVELQFYILIPIIYWFFKGISRNLNVVLIMLVVVLIGLNRFLYFLQEDYSASVLWKLYRVSFIPWLYMFLIGIFVQKNFDKFQFILRLPLSGVVLIYILVMFSLNQRGVVFDNSIPPYVVLPLFVVVLKCAYSFQRFASKWLKGNDISYGVYIWHMPLVNQYLYLFGRGSLTGVFLIIVMSFILGWLSWSLIEKPFLKLKRFSLKPINGSDPINESK